MALYVYGVMRATDRPAALGSGDGAVEVDFVEHAGLCALVSDVPDGAAVRVRRDTLMAHSALLQQALEHGPVLPLRFGVVIADGDVLRRDLLEPRAPALVARLDALQGKVEMQVKATYREEPLLRSVVGGDATLREAAARIRRLPAAATHFERIRLGELVAQAVQGRREAATRQLVGALEPLALATEIGEPQHERMALNASFLVDRDALEGFDAAVESLSAERAAEMDFRLIGPLPAHSFAEREWELEAPAWAS